MLILLSGPDSYRLYQKLAEYKKKFLRERDPTGINIETLEGENLTCETFHKAVLSGGLFVKKRLIIIKNLFSNCKDEATLKEIENYVNKYLKRKTDDDDTIVIFIETTGPKSPAQSRVKGSSAEAIQASQTIQASPVLSKLRKKLEKQKYSESFQPPEGIKLTNWLKKEVANRNGKISPEALNYLITHLGPDLWQLSNEIDKLIAYREGQEIQVEDAKLFVKTKLDENIFNLTDALGYKDKATAYKLLSEQIEAGFTWSHLLFMLARQIKILLQIKSVLNTEGGQTFARLQGARANQNSLAQILNLHPYVIQKTRPQAQNFTISELKKLHHLFVRIDINLKTTKVDPEVLFDLLITRI